MTTRTRIALQLAYMLFLMSLLITFATSTLDFVYRAF